MKATQTATTALRSARAAQPHPIPSVRFSLSEAGPSTPTTPSTSRRLPRPVLRKLVDLHHHTSTFLQDPSAFPSGFRTAFNTLHTPGLVNYGEFARRARSQHARRSLGGLDNLRIAHVKGAGAAVGRNEFAPAEVHISRSAWTGEQSWKEGRLEQLSERETRVKEALYGSVWRGTHRDRAEAAEVGLEGVEEYVEARDSGVKQDAEAWKKRHDSL